MGLSSSQGRLLMLTSRLSDIELRETLLSQRQNRLAMDSIEAADKYEKAMNNTKLTVKMADESEKSGFRSETLNYTNLVSSKYLLVDAQGNIYLPTQVDNEGNEIWDTSALLETYSGTDTVLGLEDLKDPSKDNTLYIKNVDNFSEPKEYKVVKGNDLLKNSSTLQNAIANGNLFVLDLNKEYPNRVSKDTLESDTQIYSEMDTSDDAQAESEHETALARISRQENSLEMEIKQLETQHEAILKEIDSVKNVISNNVDRTFQLFSNG